MAEGNRALPAPGYLAPTAKRKQKESATPHLTKKKTDSPQEESVPLSDIQF